MRGWRIAVIVSQATWAAGCLAPIAPVVAGWAGRPFHRFIFPELIDAPKRRAETEAGA